MNNWVDIGATPAPVAPSGSAFRLSRLFPLYVDETQSRMRGLKVAWYAVDNEGAINAGVRFCGHEAAEPPVLAGARRGDRVGLRLVDDAGNPFHVDRDVDAHGLKAIFRCYFVLQST